MEALRDSLSRPQVGLLSSFGGVGFSLLDIEIWLRIIGLSLGVIITLLNLICLFSQNKFWFCKK